MQQPKPRSDTRAACQMGRSARPLSKRRVSCEVMRTVYSRQSLRHEAAGPNSYPLRLEPFPEPESGYSSSMPYQVGQATKHAK